MQELLRLPVKRNEKNAKVQINFVLSSPVRNSAYSMLFLFRSITLTYH